MKNTKQKASMMVVVLAAFLIVAANTATGQVIYDSTVSPQPGNLPSLGAEAYAFKQLGDAVTFTGTARSPKTVTVTMSSWGCQSGSWFGLNCATTPGATFSLPITLNVYAVGSPAPGGLLFSKTQTFAIPYRPSADNINCTGGNAGKWYSASENHCYNGLANNITFDLTSISSPLPNSVVFGVSYNTTHYGPAPIGESAPCFSSSGGCGYDSLNIALSSAVVAGSKPFPNTFYWDTIVSGFYCDGGLDGTNIFRLDSPTSACWTGYVPAAQFTAYTIATTKDGCKNNGWQSLSRADASPFKNQGDCIQYVNTGK